MSVERPIGDLGPLWNRAPKTNGFRIAIPDPVVLSTHMRDFSAHLGDMPEREFLSETSDQLTDFAFGRSARFLPGNRVWEITPLDNTFSTIKLELDAAFSEKSGQWGDAVFFLEFSDQAIKHGIHYNLASQHEQIVQILKTHGLNAQASSDPTNRQVIVSDDEGKFKVIIELEPEDWEAWDASDATGVLPDEEVEELERRMGILLGRDFDLRQKPNEVDSKPLPDLQQVMIHLEDSFPLSMAGARDALRHLQIVTSYAVDAIYESLGLTPPDLVMEISENTELE